jgi:peptidyl-dipeptidase Dcp
MRAAILAGVSALAMAMAATPALAQNHAAHHAAHASADATAQNPFFGNWRSQPYGAPPFDQIRTEHYMPAFERGMAEQATEIQSIASNRARPTFRNTIEAMENSGQLLRRVSSVFFNLSATDGDEAMQAVELQVAPLLSRHQSSIQLNTDLFARIKTLYDNRDRLRLNPERRRVLELYYLEFTRAGAALPQEQRDRLAAISEQLSTLSTQFSQNQLADTAAWTMTLNGEADMAGLSPGLRAAALANGEALDRPGEYVVTLQRSSVEPFLTYSTNRALRERAFRAWAARGENSNEFDNRALIGQILTLRREYASILGYETYAHYLLADRMAQTPQAAEDLLDQVWPYARARAEAERAEMQAMIDAEGGGFQLAAWDWRFYAERVRLARYNLTDSETRPYLPLDNMIAGVFDMANRLFGLTFEETTDVPRWHPEVRSWLVKDSEGRLVGLYYFDPFARPTKQSGAWMNSFRDQERLAGNITPVIVNVMNLSPGADGEPALMSFDDAETLFHEFGHALHGLLSDVRYRYIAGTSVQRDYVEFPSQVTEFYFTTDDILTRFARHYQTGEPMPDALIAKIHAADTFNQGFATVEYMASAYVDMDLHLADPNGLDVDAVERATMARLNMPAEIIPRHRPTHFGHIFSGGYAAGYYGYMWADVISADANEAFVETGNIWDPATAARLREYVFSAGNRRDPREAYRLFRGRDAEVGALMRARGFQE